MPEADILSLRTIYMIAQVFPVFTTNSDEVLWCEILF